MTDKEKEQLSLDLTGGGNTQETDKTASQVAEKTLEWTCHPAKKNPRVAFLVTIFLLVIIGLVYYATSSVWFGVLAVLILFGSLTSYYFPTRYKFTEDSIYVRTTTQNLQKKWSQYRTCYVDKNGVLLSPFMRPSRMENFRGIYIKFWYNKDEVVAFVKERMEKNKSAESEGA
ncbi:MAG: hypothetical protein AB1746_04355 [Candidatus Zixiibacteriota bacterium]